MRGVMETANRTTAEATSRQPEAFTVSEFARAFRFSRATLYALWRDGEGPKRMSVRGRVIISRAAADEWRRNRESQAEAA